MQLPREQQPYMEFDVAFELLFLLLSPSKAGCCDWRLLQSASRKTCFSRLRPSLTESIMAGSLVRCWFRLGTCANLSRYRYLLGQVGYLICRQVRLWQVIAMSSLSVIKHKDALIRWIWLFKISLARSNLNCWDALWGMSRIADDISSC